jgi:hexosaminidase
MVDLARQWHPFNTLYFYVDLCALYKIKYLHLHFVDTQSYTLPSRKFPKMPTAGCHYSFEEIKILCDYAEMRGVELIPEIELPGHSQAMVLAYPEIFRNTPDGEVAVDNYSLFNNTDKDNIICVGKEGVMDALREILVELAQMFPNSKYIHIGGDEATITDWAHCRDCKRYMEEHGINGVKALYSHFIKEITDVVLDIGRTPIVWEGFPKEGADKISKDVVVIAWESYYLTAPDLIELGFKIINASWQPLYIIPYERAEGRLFWGAKDILAWNIYNWQNWNRKTAAYLNPINVQPTEQVIGALFCSWECVYEQEADRIRENLAALSERTWNIRRYATDAQFHEKLSNILPLTEKLSPEQ